MQPVHDSWKSICGSVDLWVMVWEVRRWGEPLGIMGEARMFEMRPWGQATGVILVDVRCNAHAEIVQEIEQY